MITLIGKDLAKKGQEFVFLGPAEECENGEIPEGVNSHKYEMSELNLFI